MGCLGVHFALLEHEVRELQDAANAGRLVDHIHELEELYLESHRPWTCQTDKAWDAIHRCLTDGECHCATGPFPLAYAILGGEPLKTDDPYYTACLVTPSQVIELSAALTPIDESWMRARYYTLDSTDYCRPLSEEDFEYTWSELVGLREFVARCAQARRFMLFTVDA